MQDISTFDIVVIVITLLLGLKGLFRGFIKEVFGLIGIVGGIFVASRLATTVGEMVAPVLALESASSIELMGFIVGLLLFWLVAYVVGMIITKIFSLSGLGIFDKILGFLFGAFKVFLIFSIIIYALSQVQAIKEKLDASLSDTMTYPILVAGGAFIIKLDEQGITKDIKKGVDSAVDKTKETVSEITKEEIEKKVEEVKEEVQKKASEVMTETTASKEETTEVTPQTQEETKVETKE